MFNIKPIVNDIVCQVNVYRNMGRPANIRVFVHQTHIEKISDAVVELWNANDNMKIKSIGDLYRNFKVNVIITTKPYVAPTSNHVLLTCGASDVIIMGLN